MSDFCPRIGTRNVNLRVITTRIALIVLALGLMRVAPCLAQPAPLNVAQCFSQANLAYERGHYEEAADGYRRLVDQGVHDAAVWYDLGNAYVQLDDLGRARVCYERALRLSPRDREIRANLAILMQRLSDRETDEDPLLHLARWFTVNELAVASSVLWFAFAVTLAAWLRRRREALAWWSAVSLGALLFVGSLFWIRWHSEIDTQQAVVIPTEVKLYNGPGRDYTASINLHAGTRVQVLQSDGDWREVGAFNRVRGWLRAEQVETI